MIYPPYLQKGDTIGMVCPAGFMAPEKWQTCVQTLQDWGFKVELGATMNSASTTYFSGTDEERKLDLQRMLDDKKIKAILCGRGGYGMGRIIDQLDFKKFERRPKWIIGFSDITVLHAHLNRVIGIASIHGPMAAAFNEGGDENPYVQSLKAMLLGTKAEYNAAPHAFNIAGTAQGRLVGGNLSLIAHLLGTRSAFKTKGKLLFLEDVGEQLYNVDRMFYQLKRAGVLDGLAGLVLGGFTDNKDTERPFGQTVEEILHHLVKDCEYPVCFGFPVSHEKENFALKVGAKYQLLVSPSEVRLIEKG
ncbi:LD-carboxypeptidase [Flavihumibacter cheonanensis]|uniref:S66 peptidase family protein n=1 Tax=Flavihumibacter cheonanensis TaxID=1442385 RepID=UPI001EF96996|nr:LD-carboxypeptidase [Flavihumibacter cheonanensis]MCG7753529.1 LD-carboxypeptidase [Flavihumibacter cheonanensis]